MWTRLGSPPLPPRVLPPQPPRRSTSTRPLLPRVIIRSLQADANTDYKDRPDEKWDTTFALSYVMTMAVPNATETKYLSSTIMLLPLRRWFLHCLCSYVTLELPSAARLSPCIFIITTVYIPSPSHAAAAAATIATASLPPSPPYLRMHLYRSSVVCIIKIWFSHSWNVEWIFNTAARNKTDKSASTFAV